MGNSEISSNNFEESKREYFSLAQMTQRENFKLINETIQKKTQEEFSLETWQNYICSKLDSMKIKEKPKINSILEKCITSIFAIEPLPCHSEQHKLKVYLASELYDNDRINETIDITPDLKTVDKAEIYLKCLDFIFKSLENYEHPLNQTIKTLILCFSTKYEKEFIDMEFSTDESYLNYLEEKNFIFADIYNSFSLNTELKMKECISKKVRKNEISVEQLTKFYNEMKDELNKLSFFLVVTVIKFYNMVEDSSTRIAENIGDKIKDLLISGDILKFLTKIKYLIKSEQIQLFEGKFLSYFDLTPKYLGTNPYFSFDFEFRNEIIKISKEKDIPVLIENIRFENQKIPLINSLKYLRNITKCETIMEKVEIMSNLRSVILNEIDLFWQGIQVSQKMKFVDADNLLSIFIYLVVRSQLSSLIVDIELIDEFVSKNIKLSRKGYFFSLVQSSLEYLFNTLDEKHIEQNYLEYQNLFQKEIRSFIKFESTKEIPNLKPSDN